MAPKAGAEAMCTRSPQSCRVGSAEDAPRVRPHELAPITGLTVSPFFRLAESAPLPLEIHFTGAGMYLGWQYACLACMMPWGQPLKLHKLHVLCEIPCLSSQHAGSSSSTLGYRVNLKPA